MTRLAALACFLAIALAYCSAHAAICGKHDDIAKSLKEGDWHEVPVVTAVISSDLLLEVYASAGGATWTIVTVRSDGLTCLEASGTDWQPKDDDRNKI